MVTFPGQYGYGHIPRPIGLSAHSQANRAANELTYSLPFLQFRLDGKKLSGAEKKVCMRRTLWSTFESRSKFLSLLPSSPLPSLLQSIPRSLTHYPALLGSASVSAHNHTPLLSASMAHPAPQDLSLEGEASMRFTSSMPSTPQEESIVGKVRKPPGGIHSGKDQEPPWGIHSQETPRGLSPVFQFFKGEANRLD